MKIKIQGHLTLLYMVPSVPHMAGYKNLSVTGPQWVKKQTLDTFPEQTIFDFLLIIFSPRSTTKFVVL